MSTLRNILRGMSSVLCIWPAPTSVEFGAEIRHRSDADAMRGDWEAVGADLRNAMHAHESERNVEVQAH